MGADQFQSSTPFPGDCFSPEGDYEPRDALFEAINVWAATKASGFVNGRSTKAEELLRTCVIVAATTQSFRENGSARRHLEQQAESSLYWRRSLETRVPGLYGIVPTADSQYLIMNRAKTPPPIQYVEEFFKSNCLK
ncbi:MULE transposase domain protein [Fusarium austroafricanum]|uniref:MULE transposase domain protein n=1 Tax=Fusarium austroafricanum TaxID=2364996 RepID=A0A8H4KBC2_9HYPO|nr:MULE transposase domain protein [Fusarium austroafricanum]